MTFPPDDNKTVKPNSENFSVLINSYLLKSSMTPEKLKKLAQKKQTAEVKKDNLRKQVLNKVCLKSVTKYNNWIKKRRRKMTNVVSDTYLKRYIKIGKRKRITDETDKDNTVKRQKLEKEQVARDEKNSVVEDHQNVALQEEDKENTLNNENPLDPQFN